MDWIRSFAPGVHDKSSFVIKRRASNCEISGVYLGVRSRRPCGFGSILYLIRRTYVHACILIRTVALERLQDDKEMLCISVNVTAA